MEVAMWKSSKEKHNDEAMISYQLKKNTNSRLTNMAAYDALRCGHSACWNEPAMGPLGVDILAFRFKMHLKKFGNVNWGYYFR